MICESNMLGLRFGAGHDVIPLWDEKTSGSAAREPALSIHLPPPGIANGSAVIVFPGGGYQTLSDQKEGTDCADWFNARGVAAFVLKYRVYPDSIHPAPLMDAQRAIRSSGRGLPNGVLIGSA